ncbi:MAG: macro domain-containing protein [Longimicrobiales bacterium]
MIELRIGRLEESAAEAILRPVAADWSPVTPAMRRLDEAAGAAVAEQCARLGELPVGSAAITAAGQLDAQFLVHVVVRSRDEPVNPAIVARALLNGLRRLAEWEIGSVALPALGTGAGNLDAEEAAEAMLPVLTAHLNASSHPSRLTLVLEGEYEHAAFAAALARHAGSELGAPGA